MIELVYLLATIVSLGLMAWTFEVIVLGWALRGIRRDHSRRAHTEDSFEQH